MRAISRGRQPALKLFTILNLGSPISYSSWKNHASKLVTQTSVVAERNMSSAANEVKELKTKHSVVSSPRLHSCGTSFDCSWNSRGWQARDGIVAAITQDTGKIIDIVHKSASCPITCKKKQQQRDSGEITSIEYLEGFIEHEISCYMNHTGSPQVTIDLHNNPNLYPGFLTFFVIDITGNGESWYYGFICKIRRKTWTAL